MTARPADTPEGSDLLPGKTWYPRGQGLARTIVHLEADDDGKGLLIYRTRHGVFTTSERDFRFWIDRLSASPPR